eukprot:5236748-Prymnesium_polylepis.1
MAASCTILRSEVRCSRPTSAIAGGTTRRKRGRVLRVGIEDAGSHRQRRVAARQGKRRRAARPDDGNHRTHRDNKLAHVPYLSHPFFHTRSTRFDPVHPHERALGV